MKKVRFLHIMGPDTKNSYGIMSQIYKNCDMNQHQFLITAYESCKKRYPKLYEFERNWFVPEHCSRLRRLLFFYKALKNADFLIWHSLFFTTQKYIYFLFLFRKFLKKSVWVEWNADLYLWEVENDTLKGKIKNYINRKIRESFKYIAATFPVDIFEIKRQFGENKLCFYTPMPNPMKGGTELIEFINKCKPASRKCERIEVQIAHNAFQFNNHVKLIDMLSKFKNENIRFIIPMSYGVYGINGRFGGNLYRESIKKVAKSSLGKKVVIIGKNIPFERYISTLWNIDIAVFDFERPCALGTLRILLLMEKKIFIPAGTPLYNFLKEKRLPVFDTNSIPYMTYEEFISPPIYTNKDWVYEYLDNQKSIEYWNDMFLSLINEKEKQYEKNYDFRCNN